MFPTPTGFTPPIAQGESLKTEFFLEILRGVCDRLSMKN
jgi:hypothetical protein